MGRGTLDGLPRFGRYVPRFVLGHGGMAEVFGAEATGEAGFSTWVALKRILPHVSDDPRFSSMFLDEARLAARIRSPHVVPTLDLGRADDGSLFLVMELVVGVTLAELTAASEADDRLPIDVVVEILAQTAEGLHDAHVATDASGAALGIVHRDVSPQNVLVGVDGRARIADFGVALARRRETHSAPGEVKGKRAFFSPEQLAGVPLDARSDVYALGVVAWQALAGGALGRSSQPLARLDALRPDSIGRPLADAVARALEERPEARPASARELADLLRDAVTGATRSRIAETVEQRGAAALARIRAGMRSEPTAVTTPTQDRPRDPRAQQLRSYGTSFVARDDDVESLARMLLGAERLVTVLGPGGMGKTRLVLEVARRLSPHFDEVVFCDLTEATTADGIGFVIGRALGVPLAAGHGASTSMEALGAVLAQRRRCLVVLDNAEQIVEPLVDALLRWLALAPNATFVCTSRERLRMQAETIYTPEPLQSGSAVAPGPAAQLFVDRARRVRPSFSPSERDWASIVEIVAQLDGLPLAIELAAARVRLLEPSALEAKMGDRFRALGRAGRDVAPRQATLDAAIRWSWDLLPPRERETFLLLSVFQGGFDVDAASAITGDEQATELVEALLDKSLLRALPRDGRLGMYESIREFARRELAQTPERARLARDRHLAHFAELARRWDAPEAPSAAQEVERELENLVAALRCALEAGADGEPTSPSAGELALQLVLAIEMVLGVRGPASLLRRLLAATLAATAMSSSELRPRAMLALARAEIAGGQVDRARASMTAAAELARSVGTPRALGWLAYTECEIAWQRGATAEVMAACEVALREATSARDVLLQARASLRLSNVLVLRGDATAGRREIERSRALALRAGDRALQARADLAAAVAAADLNDLEGALRLAGEATRAAEETGDRLALSLALTTQGALELERREIAPASVIFARAIRLLREAGQTRQEGLITLFAAMGDELAGQVSLAEEKCRSAIELNRASSNDLMLGVSLAVLGRLLATRDAADEADAALDDAVMILEGLGAPFRYEVAHLCRGHVELARARAASADGRSAEARALREAARQRATASRGRGRLLPGIEVRLTLRTLEDALALDAAGATSTVESATHPEDAEPTDAIIVDVKRRAFQPPGGVAVSLATRASLWRLLHHLALRRLAAPGEAYDVDALFAVGWEGEKAAGRSAASRVYVSMSTLRGLGLRDALERRSDGYLIRADAPLVLAE